MLLNIKVIPNAKKNVVIGNKVYVTAPPADNKANKAVIELLAEHYGVAKSKVRLVRGAKSRQKTVSVEV